MAPRTGRHGDRPAGAGVPRAGDRIIGVIPQQAAGAARQAVSELGGAYLECPRTLRRARQLGLTGWAFYVAGRAGALGDVGADTVAAALGFIAPEAVRDGWESATRVIPAQQVAGYLRLECCRWGRENLTAFFDLQRLVDLAEKIVVGAETAGMPLFAAWRAMPVPDGDIGARAAVLLDLLREHRAAAHLMAIRISGLTPLQAILAGPEGRAGATAYGWQPPFPAVQPLIKRWTWSEALTDRIAGEAYQVLSLAERHDLVRVLAGASAFVRTSGSPAGRS